MPFQAAGIVCIVLLFALPKADAGTLGKRLVCDPLLRQIEQEFDCLCDAGIGSSTIANLKVNCTYSESLCLENELLCGTPTLSAQFNLRGESNKAEACFELENDKLFKNICINGKSDNRTPLKLNECSVHYGDELCNSCTVCESGKEVTFDCSNININPLMSNLLFVPGLKVDRCFGPGLLLSPSGDSYSVGPFIPQL